MPKKLSLTLFLSILLTITFTAAAFAADFPDAKEHWAEKEINQWTQNELVSGYEDGTFKPDREVTRAEFVSLTNRAFDIKEGNSEETGFDDVSSGDWYYDEVSTAAAAGYTAGYDDNTFRPDQNITRQEVASMLANLLDIDSTGDSLQDFTDSEEIPDWARSSINAVVQNELMRGFPDNTFKPGRNITRAEAVVSLDRALELKEPQQEKPSATAIKGTAIVNGEATEDVTIRVFEDESYKVLEETRTDGEGKYNVELEPGNYDITATTEEKVAYKSDIEVTEDNITSANLSLEDAAIISGTLEDQDGNKISGTKILFTTNPTFITTTNEDGEFTLATLPEKTYTVRAYNPEEDDEPETIKDDLQTGTTEEQRVEKLTTPFSIEDTSYIAGGGGESTSDKPVVNSATITINDNEEITVQGSDNKFTIDLTEYDDKDMFTALSVNASENAEVAEAQFLMFYKDIEFDDQGNASVTVKEILGELDTGEPGVSLMSLKDELGDTAEIPITITGSNDTETDITVEIILS